MMYEISRRTGTAAWVQLGASVLLAVGIWRYHDSLSQVILVQVFVMGGLLVAVTIPLFREQDESLPASDNASEPLNRLRPRARRGDQLRNSCGASSIIREFDPYRQDFKHLVEQADLDDPQENFIRRALLFRRRGRLWRELPAGMEWWEVELTRERLGAPAVISAQRLETLCRRWFLSYGNDWAHSKRNWLADSRAGS